MSGNYKTASEIRETLIDRYKRESAEYAEQEVAAKMQRREQVEIIPRSLGAKWKNETIMNLQNGEVYSFVEGTSLKNKTVFAGKGTSVEYRNAWKYSQKYGGEDNEWKHVKAIALIETEDGIRMAEVHWSEHEKYGKHDFFVKRWIE